MSEKQKKEIKELFDKHDFCINIEEKDRIMDRILQIFQNSEEKQNSEEIIIPSKEECLKEFNTFKESICKGRSLDDLPYPELVSVQNKYHELVIRNDILRSKKHKDLWKKALDLQDKTSDIHREVRKFYKSLDRNDEECERLVHVMLAWFDFL